MPDRPRTAVLIMAYGSAPSAEDADLRAYLEHILQFYRRTSPTDEEVENLRSRYEAVGGSPLYAVTGRIVTDTQRALDLAFPGEFRVYMAMKHSPPFIEDRVREIAEEGYQHAVAVALSPFRSRLSTEGYYKLVRSVNETLPAPLDWCFAADWHLHPMFLDLWQRRLEDALRLVPAEPMVVFTNHSLPARIAQWNDPYPMQFEATAAVLADRCGLDDWRAAYQSAGGGNVPWLGPALAHVLAEIVGTGHRAVLVAPIGFMMDHLEVLYDLDIDAARMCRELGVDFSRTRMPNDDPLLVAMLVDVIRDASRGAVEAPAAAK